VGGLVYFVHLSTSVITFLSETFHRTEKLVFVIDFSVLSFFRETAEGALLVFLGRLTERAGQDLVTFDFVLHTA
jgi:hypothetical protein